MSLRMQGGYMDINEISVSETTCPPINFNVVHLKDGIKRIANGLS